MNPSDISADDAKREAARAALEELPPSGMIGLGSGTTARFFLEELSLRIRAGAAYVGVPTSEAARRDAVRLGIPLADDEGPWNIELTVDGADEVSEALDLIKGGGGAHTREKLVSCASQRTVIVVTEEKLSGRLGERSSVPVEVVRFGHRETARRLGVFGVVRLRMRDGAPFLSDGGDLVYDIAIGPMDEPLATDRALRQVPGVIETGLFVGRADAIIVAGARGVRKITPRKGP